MNKSGIVWTDMTWSPVTGSKGGCLPPGVWVRIFNVGIMATKILSGSAIFVEFWKHLTATAGTLRYFRRIVTDSAPLSVADDISPWTVRDVVFQESLATATFTQDNRITFSRQFQVLMSAMLDLVFRNRASYYKVLRAIVLFIAILVVYDLPRRKRATQNLLCDKARSVLRSLRSIQARGINGINWVSWNT